MDDTDWRLRGAIALVVAAGAGAFVGLNNRPQPIPVRSTSDTVVAAVPEIVVHVAGAVHMPGLVRVPADARVADAVEAAGGALPDAVLAAINLAAPLADGAQIVVPSAEAVVGGFSDGRVHINQAGADELDDLPGVGPVLAQRIVEHRDAQGGFKVPEDLLDVPGIGESKLASIRDLIAIP
ncbi:MAG: ComEA family DNA-binding protein [Acidimicrobiia bacterium]|nr:ComEA family DNA-binding protein [Acidimicrobiia bacterium]MDH4306731.1 ComEA family DNA-binding protein [Acidimicrobiia bacterium]MDH5293172.1 ComEA family DNA-binding protein [Acidimicrobiia bacterium]